MDLITADPMRTPRMNSDTYYRRVGLEKVQMNETPIIFPRMITADAISNEYAEMSKKNIYPHHMGSSGYVAKIPEWKKKIEEVVSAGNPNPVENIEDRTVNWLLARSKLTQDGKLVHKKKGVATV
jgi:hypothetical protein